MNRLNGLVWGVLALALAAGTAAADDARKALGLDSDGPSAAIKEDPKGQECCDKCDKCCNQAYHIIDVEATFFRLHGTELFEGVDGDDVFGFDFGPRVTVGYVTGNGLGVRARWWMYDQSSTSANATTFDVTTHVLDVETFKEISLASCTSLEWSAGVRYNDFELDDGAVVNEFSSPGIVLGLKLRQQVCGGGIYASVRHAWLMDNDERNGAVAFFDVTRMITEGAIGYEYSRSMANGSVLTLHGGLEMQNWSAYYSPDADPATDIGFGGIVVGAEWKY